MALALLGRASLEGALLFALVWLVARCFPRLSPGLRFWLWWLVSAKLLAGLLSTTLAVAVPVLAPAKVADAPSPSPLSTASPGIANLPTPTFGAVQTPGETVEQLSATRPTEAPTAPVLPRLLFALWALGVAAQVGRGALGALRLRRTLGRLQPDGDGVALCASIASPLVVGMFRPTIVLPYGLTDAEAALATAHERAHVRRGDLWLGLVPALARTVFWFHPLAHAAARAAEDAREEACDAAAIAACEASPGRYGKLLIRTVGAALPGTLGLGSGAFRSVERRLLALARPSGPPKKSALALVGLAGVVAVIPWKLTEAAGTIRAPKTASKLRATLVPLGPEGGYSDAFAINERGDVAGAASDAKGNGRAFLWSPHYWGQGGKMRDLGTFGRWRSAAYSLDDDGRAAVAAFTRDLRPKAFLSDGAAIPGLPGFRYAQPQGGDGRGTVVGSARRGTKSGDAIASRAFLYSPRLRGQGGVRDLGTLGGPYSHAFAVNAAGQVVGKADLAPRPSWATRALGLPRIATHAVLWFPRYRGSGGNAEDLGTLGGDTSRAHGIDERGQIVGQAQTATGETHGFLWLPRYRGPGGTMRDLGTLPGGDRSAANAIAPDGRIVGSATDASGVSRAVLWTPDGQLLDLNDRLPAGSGWRLETARAINARGEIVGQGVFHGRRRAFLLRPI